MTKKNKFLLASVSLTMIATASCLAVALLPKANLKAIGQIDEVWKHYSERMPGVHPGIKEYWVGCNAHTYQFTEPTEGRIEDVTGWDTTEFLENDERYTYQCVKKIADSALSDASDAVAPYGVGEGFTQVKGRAYTANDSQAISLDITNYDYVTFGLCHNMEYLLLYGGGNSGGDDPETVIARNQAEGNVNFTMWQDAWYYFTLERNAEGKWDTYIGKFATAKRASASIPMADSEKNATNLNQIIRTWKWGGFPEDAMIFCTEVYAGEKDQHHFVYESTKVSPVETGTCAVCGATTERPAAAPDFTQNRFGAKLMRLGTDVSYWTPGYMGGYNLNPYAATSLAYKFYYWDLLQAYLPRIDFSKYASVQFDLESVVITDNKDGNPVGFRLGIGTDEADVVRYADSWDNAEVSGGKLVFTTYANKVVAELQLGLASRTYTITDEDMIHGDASVIVSIGGYLNSGSYGILFKNMTLVEKPNAASINDSSIKEIYLEKQVRRVEQQDHWKTDPDYATYGNESGHADYYKFGDREAIHFSAHYASDDPKFTYNSHWSEWRFHHVQAGLTSVRFSYLYEDSNTDTGDDGVGVQVHTMAQWYGAAYQGRTMNLVADGQWHTITVTGDAYDINFFVMKIYHFTGDIYISNIIYSTNESDVTDESIKEIQLNKQVRRVEQQDHWKSDPDYETYGNESGHAEYLKAGNRDVIHFSAHYAVDDPKYTYNSNWSEWRFTHSVTGVSSVTFTYLYEDSNTDTGDDGVGVQVHTMAQWYDNNKTISANGYVGANMTLVADGNWHTVTVQAASAYDITHFVMKIYHFTGDIYISDIIYV